MYLSFKNEMIIPISKENHSDWSYVGLSNYMHTKNDAIVPILIAEIRQNYIN